MPTTAKRPVRSRRARREFEGSPTPWLAMAAAAFLLPVSARGELPPHSITPVVVEGDVVDGVPIASVDKVAVNGRGEWLVMANGAATGPGAPPEVILRGAGLGPPHVVFSEGMSMNAPFGPAMLRGFGATTAHLAETGRAALNFSLIDEFGFPGQGVLASRPGLPAPAFFAFSDLVAYSDARFATWAAFHVARVNAHDRVLLIASVDDFGLPGTSNRAAVRVQLTPEGERVSLTRLVLEGDTLLGQVRPVVSISDASQHAAQNDLGDFVVLVTLAGATPEQEAVNEALYLNTTTVLAQKGMPSPVPGRMWAALSGSASSADVGNGGDVLFAAALAPGGAGGGETRVLVRNGVVLLRSGDDAPGLSGRPITSIAGGGSPVRTDDSGDFMCLIAWNDPVPAQSTGVLFNADLLARAGVTSVGNTGETLLSLGSNGLDLADNRRFAILTGELPARPGSVGPAGAALLVSFELCSADFNGDFDRNADDLGDYINCFFGSPPCPRVDFNADGAVDADDLGDFINAYFGEC
ncbi:MAG: hypothetical protein AB7K52_15145 [Phycisphaerales bacterium]